jgi:23S rRNA (guanosine2251-2'-O)-methyltransferase
VSKYDLNDSSEYQKRKSFYGNLLTIYGRKAVLEAIQDTGLDIFRLHLAESNQNSKIMQAIIGFAKKRHVEILYHDRKALAYISRNGKQDQGIAADIQCAGYQSAEEFLKNNNHSCETRLLALDGITNPQNLGMIIRTACAGNIDAIILPGKGNAGLGPLAIKASVGTAFKAEIIRCEVLIPVLKQYQQAGFRVCSLVAEASESLFDYSGKHPSIFVLGNESDGVSKDVRTLTDHKLSIPMRNGVESLNVAITASLIAFL